MKPNVMILKEHGTNCEHESKYAFELAGAKADIVHMEDLIASKESKAMLKGYQILMLPGGFSYGDDTGSANAWANRIRNHLWDELMGFVYDDKLVLGICNGFQALVNLGLLPGFNRDYGKRDVALVHNDSARYYCRWVDLKFESSSESSSCSSPWIRGLGILSLPIAHGEGKFYCNEKVLAMLKEKALIAVRYGCGELCEMYGGHDIKSPYFLPHNPNGSLDDIAGICDETGRIFGMMPHPERAIFFTQLPNWTKQGKYKVYNSEKGKYKGKYLRSGKELPEKELPKFGPGLRIFENAVQYFQ